MPDSDSKPVALWCVKLPETVADVINVIGHEHSEFLLHLRETHTTTSIKTNAERSALGISGKLMPPCTHK